MCSIVNLKNDAFDVYIGRGSKWGNPFILGKDGDRDRVVRLYAELMVARINGSKIWINRLRELSGKKLGCYCKPEKCHGDVLKWLIDKYKL